MRRARTEEQGQVSALAALVLVAMAVIAIGIAAVGTVIVERHSATVAADATALASVTGASSGSVLAEWYRSRGIEVVVDSGHSTAVIGEESARSHAVSGGELRVGPAVVAIVARAEQLLGRPLESARLDGLSVSFTEPDAKQFDSVAADLGMCIDGLERGRHRYRVC